MKDITFETQIFFLVDRFTTFVATKLLKTKTELHNSSFRESCLSLLHKKAVLKI